MKKPFKKSLQIMSPASKMEAARHASSFYWAHGPRAPDIDYLIPDLFMNNKHVSAIIGLHVKK